jgi:uncharacterized membrane protein YdfJ with MMPL/SSD domain
LVGAISSVAPSLAEVTTNEQDEFLPAGAESVEALKLRTEKFPAVDGVPALVVFNSKVGSNDLDATVREFTDLLRSSEVPQSFLSVLSPSENPAAASTLISADGKTALVIVTIGGVPSEPAFGEAVDWLSESARELGAIVEIDSAVTGPAGIINDAVKVFGSIDLRVTLVTVVLVLVLLLIIYRSPILAIVPLLSSGLP